MKANVYPWSEIYTVQTVPPLDLTSVGVNALIRLKVPKYTLSPLTNQTLDFEFHQSDEQMHSHSVHTCAHVLTQPCFYTIIDSVMLNK